MPPPPSVPAPLTDSPETRAIPITPLVPGDLGDWLEDRPAASRAWVAAAGFTAEPGAHLLIPGVDGGVERVLAGIDGAAPDGFHAWGGLPSALPAGDYTIDGALDAAAASHAALGWYLGSYEFARYKAPCKRFATLLWPLAADRAAVERAARAVFLVRDLINTPAADMGPAALAAAAETLAAEHKARCEVIVGDALLAQDYPAIHAVGRAAAETGPRAPRLIDLRWSRAGGHADDPAITLVGKGVCFDSGGLDLKPAAAMKLMKKDMGGAAHVLGLARMMMEAELGVRLRVLVPAVENSVAGDALRPLDVVATRAGISVEIGHTDAEGRLVLADALAEAGREAPTLIVDCATLTGAARTALGTDIPALFCNDDAIAAALLGHAAAEADPLWRLPLWPGYRKMIDGKTADLTNSSESGFAGAITAALFLQEFVGRDIPWVHLDLMGWNMTSRPGRPEGGEAMGIRALFALIAARVSGPGTDD